MPSTTTLNEVTRSPVDGTEFVRLATPGNNWKAQLTSVGLIPLTFDLTVYVDGVLGNDSNNGLTPATAFLTIQHAIIHIVTTYVDSFNPTTNDRPNINIQCADGTYVNPPGTFGILCFPMANQGSITISGHPANRNAVTVQAASGQNAFYIYDHANYSFNSLTINADPGTSNIAFLYDRPSGGTYGALVQIRFTGNWSGWFLGVNGGFVYIDFLVIEGTAAGALCFSEGNTSYIFFHHGVLMINQDPMWSEGYIELNYQGQASFKTSITGSHPSWTGAYYTITGGCTLLSSFPPSYVGISSAPPSVDRGAEVLNQYRSPGPFSAVIHPTLGDIPAGQNYQTPLTGASITLGDTDGLLLLNPAGTLAALTVVFFPDPEDGQTVEIQSTQTITALTVSPNAGQSVVDAPNTLIAGQFFKAVFNLANTTWYCAIGSASVGTGVPGGATNSVQYNAGAGVFGGAGNFSISSSNPNIATGGQLLYNGSQVLQAQPALGNFYEGGSGNLTGTGTNNLATGPTALQAVTTGSNNVCFGEAAGKAVTTGGSNILFGTNSGNSLTTEGGNAFIGFNAGQLAVGVTNSLAVGNAALGQAVGGDLNTAIGTSSLLVNAGNFNVAIGNLALETNTGNNCVGVGSSALRNATSGSSNVGIGANSLTNLGGGTLNTAIGHNAGLGATLASNANVFIGDNIMATSSMQVSFNTILGSDAGQNLTGVANVSVGYQSLSGASGSGNVAVGYQAGTNIGAGNNNIVLGPSENTITTGSNNVSIGSPAGVPSATASNQMSIQNIIYGTGNAGTGVTISTGNIGIGIKAPAVKLDVAGSVKTASSIVSALPAPGNVGARNFVTDASGPVFGNAVVGLGAVAVPVYDDGATWRVG